MKYGAGVLFICPSSRSILLALRTDSDIVWGNFGGIIEKQETAIQCAKREVIEETGFFDEIHYEFAFDSEPLDVSLYKNFMYTCYLAVVDKEIEPKLNYEHSTYKWFNVESIPQNLHFGIKNILLKMKVRKRLDNFFRRLM